MRDLDAGLPLLDRLGAEPDDSRHMVSLAYPYPLTYMYIGFPKSKVRHLEPQLTHFIWFWTERLAKEIAIFIGKTK